MIYTKSKFYYGHTVDANSNIILFDEGSGDVTATMRYGKYSLTDYANEVVRSMNAVSNNSYTVSVNRTTRVLTISGTSNFSFDPVSAGTGNSAFPLMGYTAAKSGSNSYAGDTGSGSEYVPQFRLQNYVDFDYNKEFLQGTVKTSASGIPEIVSYGLARYMECNITFINSQPHDDNSPIEENLTGLEDAVSFMNYAITKGNMEFIADRDTPNTYYKVILESTATNRDGIGYTLRELTNRNINDYYETRTLTFRELT